MKTEPQDETKQVDSSIDRIPVNLIDVDDENHRRRDLDVANLAESIKSAGQRQPICVYKAGRRYNLVYGFRRLEACKSLGWEVIRAEVIDKIEGEDLHQFRAAENLDRKDLTPVEEAVAVTRIYTAIMGDGDPTRDMAIDKVAKKLGKTSAWVRDRVYLLERCTKKTVQMALDDHRITVGHLRELAKVGDDEQQERLCSQIVSTSKDWRNQHRVESVEVQSIESLREEIGRLERSLDRVPWVLNLPVGKLPACVGCPSNTATDETLFGKDHKGDDVGQCMNEACYRKKCAAAERADKKVAAKIERMKEKDASIETIRKKSPDWAKPERIQRYVKKNVKGCAPKAEKKKAGKAKASAEADTPVENPNKKAIEDFSKAHDDWENKAIDLVHDGIKKRPLSLLLLHVVRDLYLDNKSQFVIPNAPHYSAVKRSTNWKTNKTTLSIGDPPKALSPKHEAAVRMFLEADASTVEKLAHEALEYGAAWYGEVFDSMGENPLEIQLYAKLLGIELEPYPERPKVSKSAKPKASKSKAAKKKKKKAEPAFQRRAIKKKAAKVKPAKKRAAKK